MTEIRPVIFPDLKDKTFTSVNLAELARPFIPETGTNPFLNVAYFSDFMTRLHDDLKTDYTWGGYLEDRSVLWRGTYLQPDYAVHVGIDVDVPAGTRVTLKYPGHVAAAFRDKDQDGGWGGTVIVELDKPVRNITHVLYAHLAHDILPAVGDLLTTDAIVGHLGLESENGGWFEHLHVQAFTQEAWAMSHGDLKNFDGYDKRPKGKEHPLFPDPTILL